MNAKLMLNERHILSDNAFVETVVWSLSSPVSKSHHSFKYRLALVVEGNCVLRLLKDFWNDVDNWRF